MKETGFATAGYNLKNCTFYANGNVTDINDVLCAHKYVYDRGNGRKTAYLHYVDGMEIWELTPGLWKGWKLMHRTVGEEAQI